MKTPRSLVSCIPALLLSALFISGLSAKAQDATTKMTLGLTGKNITKRSDYSSDTIYWTGSMGWGGTYDWNSIFWQGDGFFDNWGTDMPGAPETGYLHGQGIQVEHASWNGGGYGWQMMSGNSVNGNWYLRGIWGGGFLPWYKIIHSGNIGSYATVINGLGQFSGGTQVGNGASVGLFNDSTNLALRAPNSPGDIYFQTASGAATNMIIKNGGNVGIGTNSPAGTITPAGKLTINGSGGSAASSGIEFFSNGNASGYGGWVGRIYSGVPTGGWATAPFTFAVPDGSGNEIKAMTMLNGNVGIGTSSPGLTLDVNGPVRSTSGSIDVRLQAGAAGAAGVGSFSNDPLLLIAAGTERMRITTTGNVGIGNVAPSDLLDIAGPNGTTPRIRLTQASQGTWTISEPAGTNSLAISQGGGAGIEYMRITGGAPYAGNVGIGTSTPNASLDIWKSYYAGTDSLRFSFNDGSAYWMGIQPYVAGSSNVGYRFRTNNVNTTVDALAITGDGKVGIGTLNPTQKLSVNGTIRAKEMIVDTGWADYVFEDSYRLAPLAEVEQHIKAEKHLPGIPSAQEIAEHGVSMGDMQSKLLSKIEEITLHQIAQEKAISALQAENTTLKAQNAKFQQKLGELQAVSAPKL